jgi:hypothetical protein
VDNFRSRRGTGHATVKLFDVSSCLSGPCVAWPADTSIGQQLFLVASETNRGQGNYFFPPGSYGKGLVGFNAQYWIKDQCARGCGAAPRKTS